MSTFTPDDQAQVDDAAEPIPAKAGRGRPARYTRAGLLELVVGVFNDRGYEAASMDDLAKASGLTKSTFYHHVSGKEELLGMAVNRALDALSTALDETADSAGPQVQRLELAIRRTTEVLLAELPYVTLLLRVRGNTEVERAALTRRRAIDARLAALVSAAADAGEIRADIDPRLVSRLLFGMVNSITEWYRPGNQAAAGKASAQKDTAQKDAAQKNAAPKNTSPTSTVDAVVSLALQGLRPQQRIQPTPD